MDSDEFYDIPEVKTDFVVQQYMFEPTSDVHCHKSSAPVGTPGV